MPVPSAEIPATPTFHARRAMVTTTDHLATGAGVAALRAGGSAADAAVAAAAVLAVTSPEKCGLGGDLFALVHRDGEERPAALNASGRAGSGADAQRMRAEGHRSMPMRGDIRTVTVPGCVDGWLALHGRFGRLPLAEVFGPAVELAEAGFPMSATLARAMGELDETGDLRHAPAALREAPRRAGTLLRRPGHAQTLRAIAAHGRDAFYGGTFGEGLLALGAGLFSPADLARGQADWVEPLGVTVWGARLWSVPPNSQGYLTLLGAAVAARLPLPADPDEAAWAHLLVEAAVAAGHDRPSVLHEHADVGPLLADAEVARRAGLVDAHRRAPIGLRAAAGDTTQLCVIDGDRLGVSLIQSNAANFGSTVFEPSTGIELHNRGVGFSLRPGDPAEWGPGRRPPHTLSPALLTRPGGGLRAVLGSAGGDAQPHVTLQLLARLLHAGQTPGEAVGAPRFRLGAPTGTGFDTWEHPQGTTVLLERGAPAGWTGGLTARGHAVRVLPVAEAYAGHAHLLEVGADGVLAGATEPRAGNGAVGGL
ncbi:gamma-glutamyltransferase family protein [Dactylosporangium sp. CA-092794]|uniref:gamma-glutamyltransferase family protein n=1 Tax=Dactylosporangium sp. CA-092794 TaxID=3239929 RepID=UPI003D8C021E